MKTEKRIEKLSLIISNIISKINKPVIVADIATDHGYLAEKLSKFELVEKVIATDISEKSLSKLIVLIEKNKLTKIETKVGDGLLPIEYADVSVIAGIGGVEITKIIDNQNKKEDGSNRCNIFVLQPAQNDVWLRNWIYKKGYKVIDDCIISNGDQFYPVMCIDISKRCFYRKSTANLYLGLKRDLNDADFIKYLQEKAISLEFLNNLSKSRINSDKELKQKYKLNKIIARLLKKC